jgi:bifunctional non-homologous end joining protein LigD
VQLTAWSGAGRVRHPVYLGIREDKSAAEVVRPVADPEAERVVFAPRRRNANAIVGRKGWHGAVPPVKRPATAAADTAAPCHRSSIVIARPPKRAAVSVGGVELSHPTRELWPGITKRQLAEYWQAVAEAALPGLARRPLAIVRCPGGINGKEHFFQKNGHGFMPAAIREGRTAKQPYLAIGRVDRHGADVGHRAASLGCQ